MAEFTGKSIIVTGGASLGGIGEAAVRLLAQRGANVTIADVDEKFGETLEKQIRADGGTAQFVRTDITSEEQVKAMVAAAVAAYGRLDGAFNNAGVIGYAFERPALFADIPLDAYRKVNDINATGTFLCMKYEIPAMLKSGGGAIVNNSSAAGLTASPGAGDYVASKHAVIGLTKSAALDYATQNIRVNAVLPGLTRTPLVEKVAHGNPDFIRLASESMPIKRMGEAREVAEAALWLLSDAASLVTGHSMSVDGGYTMV